MGKKEYAEQQISKQELQEVILTEEQKKELLLKEKEILTKKVDTLLKKRKGIIGEEKKLRQLKQPIVILLRNWKDIEIYEDIKGSTFIVPLPPEHSKFFGVGDLHTKKPGKRVVYLSPSDLYTLQYGADTIKAYIVKEDDAMPVGADSKVWSERLEYTIDALLLNFEQYKKNLDRDANKWIVDLVKWGGIVVIGFFLLKWVLMPDSAANDVPAAKATIVESVKQTANASGITTILH